MKEVLKVKKWGGENAAEFRRSPENVVEDFEKGIKQCVVVSAIRSSNFNTTDNLIKISELIALKKDYSKLLELTVDFHLSVVDDTSLKNGTKNLKQIIIDFFEDLDDDIQYNYSSSKFVAPKKENDYSVITKYGLRSILGTGEELSALINTYLINNLHIEGLEAENVDLNGLIDDIHGIEEDIFNLLSMEIADKLSSIIISGKVPVLSGYVPGFEGGIENVVGRGYSDAISAMASVGLSGGYDVVLEIQKSVKGMLSADPRIVEKTKLIDSINYSTAKEIIGARGAQAKLLHSQVLRRELQDAGIKIKLFDPFIETKGTTISEQINNNSSGVEFVGGRNNITVFSVSSSRMEGNGILFSIFGIVKDYTSVDIVSTSETEVSFTIDNNLSKIKLEELSSRIRQALNIRENSNLEFVRYDLNKALVYCIGQNLSHSLGSLGRAAMALSKGGVNIEMVSQGITERAMTFGVKGTQLQKAINLLHDEFID